MNVKTKINKGWKTDEDGIKLPTWTVITNNFTDNHVKRYENCIWKIAKLSTCATLLLEYLTEEMHEYDNTVYNTKANRKKFIDFIKACAGITYKDTTVKIAFKELVDVHLLIDFKSRGTFIVNPRHFYRGYAHERKQLIEELVQGHYNGDYPKSNLKEALGLK